MQTAKTNAADAFMRHRLRRQSDHNARARDLRSLQTVLALPEPPLRIEAYDISTIQGRHTVGSMVVLEDGLPRRSHYRRFRIRTVQGQDDLSSMEEVIRRRFAAFVQDLDKPVSERGKFAYPPSLVLIDGGPGQIGRAVEVLDRFDLEIPVAGLAKRMEEVLRPGTTRAHRHPARPAGPSPPAAGQGRGPPLRAHVPPPAPGQTHDRLPPGRCATASAPRARRR